MLLFRVYLDTLFTDTNMVDGGCLAGSVLKVTRAELTDINRNIFLLNARKRHTTRNNEQWFAQPYRI